MTNLKNFQIKKVLRSQSKIPWRKSLGFSALLPFDTKFEWFSQRKIID